MIKMCRKAIHKQLLPLPTPSSPCCPCPDSIWWRCIVPGWCISKWRLSVFIVQCVTVRNGDYPGYGEPMGLHSEMGSLGDSLQQLCLAMTFNTTTDQLCVCVCMCVWTRFSNSSECLFSLRFLWMLNEKLNLIIYIHFHYFQPNLLCVIAINYFINLTTPNIGKMSGVVWLSSYLLWLTCRICRPLVCSLWEYMSLFSDI